MFTISPRAVSWVCRTWLNCARRRSRICSVWSVACWALCSAAACAALALAAAASACGCLRIGLGALQGLLLGRDLRLLRCLLRLLHGQLLLTFLLLLDLAQGAYAGIFRVLHRAARIGDHDLALALLAVERLRIFQFLLSLGKNIRGILRRSRSLSDLDRIDGLVELKGRFVAWLHRVQHRVLARPSAHKHRAAAG